MRRIVIQVQARKKGKGHLPVSRLPGNSDGIQWIATLELNHRQIVNRLRWAPVAGDWGEEYPYGYRIPPGLSVGDFIEIRADRKLRRGVSVEKRLYYALVVDVGNQDGLGRAKGPVIFEAAGQHNLATPVLERREEILGLMDPDSREGALHAARNALSKLNPRERDQLFEEFRRLQERGRQRKRRAW
jgi:hypothetical protein